MCGLGSLSMFRTPVDPGPLNFTLVGCAVLLLEEDETSDEAITAGQSAFQKAIHQTLNNLI
jgi:hypothetical protein